MNPDLLRRISAEFDRIEEAAARGESIELDDLFSDLPEADRAIALREVQELLEELHHSGHPFSSATSAASLSARFDPVEPTNQGGMGEIWLAIDQDFNRHVAIKEIIPSAAQDEDFRRRFFREAEITAKLEHPGILPVYGKGTHADGRPFYAMRWVAGAGAQTLQEAIRELHAADQKAADTVRFLLPDLLQRFVSVCQTIAFAHHAGVIHRDLKPANILLGPFGETFVVDWGLAIELGEPASLVAPLAGPARSVVGTPGFVAPECLENPQRADQRSDIYSLGLILYQLCAGSSPFTKSAKVTPEKLQAAVLRGEIPPLRTVSSRLHPALEAICRQATAVDPARRYASARDLAADVSRYLSGLPTQAWPESWRYRIRRWIQSHTAAVATLGMTILLSLCGAVGYGWITSRHNVALSDKSVALENALQAESKQKLAAVEMGRVGGES
jgi:serine/threonine protein kinase